MTLRPSAGTGAGLDWYKSSHSTDDGPSCIEVAVTPGTVHVRDSKDPHGPQLAFTPEAWAAFVSFAIQT